MPDKFSKVDKNIYRGGRPSAFDIQYLSDHGIKKIVSLDEDIAKEIYPICRKFNIEHKIIPLTTGDGENVDKLPEEVLSWKNTDKPIYIHCKHGKDRTSMICALYRILVQGWDVEKALKEAAQFGMGKGLEHGQTYYDGVRSLANINDLHAISLKIDAFKKLAKIKGKINIEELKNLPWNDVYDYIKNSGAQYLGGGSSRDTYILSSKYVIKIAKNEAGEAQNKAELELSKDPRFKNIVADTISAHPSFWWIISELVKPFSSNSYNEFYELTGMEFSDFTQFIMQGPYLDPEEIAPKPDFAKNVLKLVKNKILSPADVGRLDNWGKTADGRVVILDYGATPEIIEQFYTNKDTEHPEEYDDKLQESTSTTDPELLSQLSIHQDSYIRRHVANNPYTPVAILEKLTKDSDEMVSQNAKNTLNTLNQDDQHADDIVTQMRDNFNHGQQNPAINNQSIPNFSPSWAPYSDSTTEHLKRPANLNSNKLLKLAILFKNKTANQNKIQWIFKYIDTSNSSANDNIWASSISKAHELGNHNNILYQAKIKPEAKIINYTNAKDDKLINEAKSNNADIIIFESDKAIGKEIFIINPDMLMNVGEYKKDENNLNVGDIQNYTGLAPFSFPGVSGPMGGVGGAGFTMQTPTGQI